MTGHPAERAIELRDGRLVSGLDWGGRGPAVLFLHPNGFCAGLFDPIARRLTDRFRVVGVDLRGHGGSTPPASLDDFAYAACASDVLAWLDDAGVDEVGIVGESLGGGVASLVEHATPGRVTGLLLCEPIAIDDEALGLRRAEHAGENVMAALARRRREVWPDRPTVRASYGTRPPLDAMAPEALDAYVRWGFRDRADGQVELACPREVEAGFFEIAPELGPAPAFAHFADLRCPATFVAGTGSFLPIDWFRAQAHRAGALLLALRGGHFVLHEDTTRAVELVADHLG